MVFKWQIAAIGEVTPSKNGAETLSFIVDEGGESQYPNSMSFQLYDKRVALLDGYAVGDSVEVSYWAKAKEYNGKFYTTLSPWKITGEKTGKEMNREKTLKQAEEKDSLPF